MVVVHHSLLIAPSLADGYRAGYQPATGSWPWLMLHTPLHPIWAGGEAVFVFFVLSGFVLALPSVSGRQVPWRSYYPSRLVRLYVLITVAVAFAYVLVRLVPRKAGPRSSWWLAGHTSPVSGHEALHDAAVVRGTTGLNSALWSLQWEVIFSLLLPVFVLSLVRWRQTPPLKLVLLFSLVVASPHSGHTSLLYLPIFGLGVVMAQQSRRLDWAGQAFDRLRQPLRCAAVAGVLLLLIARWWLEPLGAVPGQHTGGLILTLGGACGVVWLFASSATGSSFGSITWVQWLGKRSFSLYLVHAPIVVTVAYLLGATRDAALVLVIALPLSLLVAEVFGRLCEGPSHQLARRAGAVFRPAPVVATA